MQHKFKLGDKVKTLKSHDIYGINVFPVHTLGTIINIDTNADDDEQCYLVESHNTKGTYWYSADELSYYTNKDYLFSLPNKDLAKYLIHITVIDDGDYAFDGEDEYYISNPRDYYTTPANDMLYDDWSLQEAIEDTVRWLESEYNKNNSN